VGSGLVLVPESLNGVGIHLDILTDEGEGIVDGLSDENPIERVAVMEG